MEYIVTQVAKPKENKVPQMKNAALKTVDDAMRVYIKNAIVALASAKINNPDAACILNCNFEIPIELKNIAERAGIEICFVPFGKYESKEEFSWAITQYKFDSMDYVLEHMSDEDCMVLLDTDTICTHELEELFEEAKSSLMLYPVNHGYLQDKRQRIRKNYQKLYKKNDTNIIHYGGEFFAGNKKLLQELLAHCHEIILRAKERTDLDAWDDEHILSIAAEHFMKDKIYSASPYICRYWTNKFYLVSTNYFYDPVSIWHLPAEKNYGMIVLYEYFEKNHSFPDIRQMARIVGFPGTGYKRWNPYRWKVLLRNKLKG